MNSRRFLLTSLVSALAAPLAAEAQTAAKMPMVGVLNSGAGPRSGMVDITRQGLRDLGYVEGQTIAFDVRFAAMKYESFPGLAGDLVRRKVDVILASGPAAIRAAKDATSTIPIVAVDLESDPVQAGLLVASRSRMGTSRGAFSISPAWRANDSS
jgi:putative tryptophan/tyrosine transport system substrate-binding protein